MNVHNVNMFDTFIENDLSYISETSADEDKPISDEIIKSSKSKGVIGKIGGIGADSNKPTRNGRRYPLELWQNVEKSEYFIEGMENRCIVGECDHPQERLDYSVSEGAIVLTKYDIQDDGTVYTEFDILDTLPGRTLKTYFDAGCKVGVSSRGLGEEKVVNNETIIDPDTYQFYCFDAVLFPAVKTARMELIESTSPKRQSFINSINAEIKNCKTLDECTFIENTAKETNLYLDEIKSSLDNRKNELSENSENDKDTEDTTQALAQSIVNKIEKKHNKTKQDSELSNFLKAWLGITESISNNYKGDNWNELLVDLKNDGFNIDSVYVTNPEEKIILYRDDETYTADVNKYHDGRFEVVFDTIKPVTASESNKIKISEKNSDSDEDTLEDENNSDLIILAELEKQADELRSKNEQLNNTLEQQTNVIKNLLAINYSQETAIMEQSNISKNLINHKIKSEKINDDYFKLMSTNKKLQSKLNSLTSKYEKLQAANQEFSNMLESLNKKYLTEKDAKNSILKKLENIETNASNLNLKLKSSLTESTNRQSQVKQLNEEITNLNSENSALQLKLDESSSLLDEKEKFIINLKTENSELNQQVIKSLEKYIEMTCSKYNLHKPTLKRLLGETYTFTDVDKIAKELVETNAKINSLPYAQVRPERRIISENIGLVDNSTTNKDIDNALENFQFMLESKFN